MLFMKKRAGIILFSFVFLISIVLIIAAYSQIPNPGHGGEDAYVSINSQGMTLQKAIDDKLFENCDIAGGTYSSAILFGHAGDEIIINVNGDVKTLQAAINDKSLVNTNAVGTSPAVYSGISISQYQTADKITIKDKLRIEKTLQQSINDGGFKCVPPVVPTCSDGIMNQGETGIDCGGPCGACVECRYDHANPVMDQGNYYYKCDCSYCGSEMTEPTLKIYWDGTRILNQIMSTPFVCPDLVIIGNYKYFKGSGPYHQTEFEICREKI
jgi:hypothetical protein